MKDLRALGNEAVEIVLDEPITGIRIMPPLVS